MDMSFEMIFQMGKTDLTSLLSMSMALLYLRVSSASIFDMIQLFHFAD